MFLGLFVLLLVLQVEWWVAAVAAAVIALCISYIFLSKLRARVAQELHDRRQAGAAQPADHSDEGIEDGLEAEPADPLDSERERGSES
jgi:Ca2+/Na+ antiporter